MDLADYLLPQPPEDRGSWRWATVTQVDPLRVRLDGDSTALDLTPETLVVGLQVGWRVWCQIHGQRVVVHGAPASAVDTGWLSLTLNAGLETKSGTARYRRIGNRVQCGGLVGPTSGSLNATTDTDLCTLPVGFRPAQSEWFAAGSQRTYPPGTLVILGGGTVTLRPPGVALPYVGLGGVTFLTD